LSAGPAYFTPSMLLQHSLSSLQDWDPLEAPSACHISSTSYAA
jgi:hypothetical protein